MVHRRRFEPRSSAYKPNAITTTPSAKPADIVPGYLLTPRGKNIYKLQSVQIFVASITGKFDRIKPALKDPLWLPIKQHLYYFRDAALAFKCVAGCAPRYLNDQFTTRNQVIDSTTLYSQILNIPLFKTASGQRTFNY